MAAEQHGATELAPHVSAAAEALAHLGPIVLTNSLRRMW